MNLYLATLLRNSQILDENNIVQVTSQNSKCYHKKFVKPSTVLEHQDLLLQMFQIHNPSVLCGHGVFSLSLHKCFSLNDTYKPPKISFAYTS